MIRLMFFAAGSVLLAAISRRSLLAPRSHGFFRFFAWEAMLALVLLNALAWFQDPFAPHQVLSWLLLAGSLIPLIAGIRSLREHGEARGSRAGDPTLLPLETTTALVTTGVYGMIRHPLYASLLLLTWGSFFKSVSWAGGLLAAAASLFLVATARADEAECLQYFGEPYRSYMRRTRMFIPHIL